jgi:hypothetical protein
MQQQSPQPCGVGVNFLAGTQREGGSRGPMPTAGAAQASNPSPVDAPRHMLRAPIWLPGALETRSHRTDGCASKHPWLLICPSCLRRARDKYALLSRNPAQLPCVASAY